MIIVIGEWERDKGHFCWLMNCINNWMRYSNPVVKQKPLLNTYFVIRYYVNSKSCKKHQQPQQLHIAETKACPPALPTAHRWQHRNKNTRREIETERERENARKTSKQTRNTGIWYWNLFTIFIASLVETKNLNRHWNWRLCIKIDGITFDCSPSVHTRLHMCVLWTETNRIKTIPISPSDRETHRTRYRERESCVGVWVW